MKVLFLTHTPSNGGDVFAYFPEIKWDSNGNKMSYEHVGQHGACSPEYVKECQEAKTNDYMLTLLPELKSVGYKTLAVLNSQEIEYYRPPTATEVAKGFGATHYKSFPLSTCINQKTGKFKKWLVDEYGFRYYRNI